MCKKWLAKYLPDRHQITNQNDLRWLGTTLHHNDLWHLNRTAVSRGVACGLLVAFIPLPIQTISAILLAVLMRGNIIVAIVATWISNPFTFLPINYVIFQVGKFVTGDPSQFHTIEVFHTHNHTWAEYFNEFVVWIQSLGKPFLFGIPIVSLAAALIGYLVVNIFWQIIIMFIPHLEKKPEN